MKIMYDLTAKRIEQVWADILLEAHHKLNTLYLPKLEVFVFRVTAR